MVHSEAAPFLALVLLAVKGLMLVAGGSVFYYAVKAYRRTRDQSLGYLAGGFGLVLFGSAIGGLVYELIGSPLAVGVIIESVFVLFGFILIAYSLKR